MPAMEALREQWPVFAVMVALGVAAAAVLVARGYARRDVFDDVRPRVTGLTLIDLVIGLFIMLVGMVAIGPILQMMGYPVSEEGFGDLTARQQATLPLISQGVTQLPVVLFVLARAMRFEHGLREFGLTWSNADRDILAGALALPAAVLIVLAVNGLFVVIMLLAGQDPPDVAHELLAKLRDSDDDLARGLMIVSAVLIAPVLEELLFRGLVQSALIEVWGETNRWGVILMASAIFAGVHVTVVPLYVMPGLFALGVILGWLYERRRSLWPCIVLHMGFNAVNVMLAFGR